MFLQSRLFCVSLGALSASRVPCPAGAAKDTALDTASQVCSVYEASTEALEALFGLDHEFVVAWHICTRYER